MYIIVYYNSLLILKHLYFLRISRESKFEMRHTMKNSPITMKNILLNIGRNFNEEQFLNIVCLLVARKKRETSGDNTSTRTNMVNEMQDDPTCCWT